MPRNFGSSIILTACPGVALMTPPVAVEGAAVAAAVAATVAAAVAAVVACAVGAVLAAGAVHAAVARARLMINPTDFTVRERIRFSSTVAAGAAARW
jgi:hypothetical protein